ncbi:group 1 glycosyl transferase [Salinisphaera sp. T31B1]
MSASKVTVINNGVASPIRSTWDDKAKLREALGLTEEYVVVGSVGRMEDESHKRFGDLIKAFSRLATPLTRLLLVGDGGERPGLEALCERLSIRDKVLFVGYQADTYKYYELMDIFALASEREAFGLVNAEAMRCSLPVVATRVGGIPDVVEHEKTGLLVPPRDVDAMAKSLFRLISDPSLRECMGAAGKLRADREFSAEGYVARVESLYQRLWQERRR